MSSVSKTILLLISHSCNLNCKYCYEWHKDSRKMTWEQVKSILEFEFMESKESIDGIDLLGGEPLINFDVIPLISDWLLKYSPRTKISIRTNGTLLTDDMKIWFVAHKSQITLGLSIDGTPEVNSINRGKDNADLQYFLNNWPNNPVKVTVFPSTVHKLYESMTFLYGAGAKVIAGLAQGVNWDAQSCVSLETELVKLTEYYLNTGRQPAEPLYDLNFDKSFWTPDSNIKEDPCWEQANIHSYDCDGAVLPCHMFSIIVQGKKNRAKILEDAKRIDSEQISDECICCPIRWCCKNCMAMNYQHTGEFGNNINLKFICRAQKIAAEASAEYLVRQFQLLKEVKDTTNIDAISNAIKYLKLRRAK